MLQTILNKSWEQHTTKQQMCGHLPPISKTIQVRRTRRAGYCRRYKNELLSDILLWIPSNGPAKVTKPARTYTHQLWRCQLCNGYRRKKWTPLHEFKSWTRLIAFYIALIPMRKLRIKLFFLQLWVNSRAYCVLYS